MPLSNKSNLFLIPLAIGLILTLWIIPYSRAIQFYWEASDSYQEQGSINAYNDLTYSKYIIIGYTISLFVGLITAIAFTASRHLPLIFPFWAVLIYPLYIILARHEAVIIIFPTYNIYLHLAANSILFLTTLALLAIRPSAPSPTPP